ncbi:UDP-N-acetylmuramoyl-L-alanyl-D-glutamate--2,6-diaminopimelate ligase [Oceanicoccus sp. KOV_DT_Chl]|uniref:UDP-N-acetylmuramoyl-L-alanyl-D-glutamate--2, 6-diaminopimelate ligase n=1 Tax=Oceanicoccus sp. KOV_DT_Chl TaxID=1904639 RepID=UPI00190ECCEB|nr:UDP-N-acetylmuramoyl-L-alanyl-D-glutamate--2,6-diaminopimelate ligase [Oceanicoccus sp. KOV_DT_Chl]
MMTAIRSHQATPLSELITVNDTVLADVCVSGLALDSRQVVVGDLFLACSGLMADGRDFIPQAIAQGAVAVLAEKDDRYSENSVHASIPVMVVADLTMKLSDIAGRFYSHPSQQMSVIGVTGTNGKTSCTQLIAQLLEQLQQACGVIGTLGVSTNAGITTELSPVLNTTPDAITIQKILAQWHQQNVNIVAMEVSSHGLEQGRVSALHFELALFTNLSRDHLDYHGTMQAYAEAKARLFRQPGLKKAVVNMDDSFTDTLAAVVSSNVEVLRYSINGEADVWVDQVSYHSEGVSARLHSPWGSFDLLSPLLGAFNLSNVVAALASLAALNYDLAKLVAALPAINTIEGRMQRIESAANINVIVDYAHTPDALEKALTAVRQHADGKVWCVFGCGGDRDQGKRPQMGEIAQRYADFVVVTSDNPRNEPAAEIINQVLGGIDCPAAVEEDRAKAIAFAITNAQAGDSILIAGKGHEDYQLIADQRIPFSDIKEARLALARRVDIQRSMEGVE